MTLRYAYALDLVDDAALIAQYEEIHQQIWPEVREHLLGHGIQNMEIYRLGTRLFMLMEVDAKQFDRQKLLEAESSNPIIQKWEAWMWKFQKKTPWTAEGQKWTLMQKIFSL